MSAGTSRRSRAVSGASAVCFETGDDGDRRRVRLARDRDPADRDSITTAEPDASEYDDPLPRLPPPGSGDRNDDCGDDKPRLYCRSCGDAKWVGHTCRRSRCPRCWQSWAFQQAREVVTGVERTRQERYAASGTNVWNHHVVVSFPDGTRFNSDDALDRGFEAVKQLLGEVNADAGYLVYHPFRIAEEYRGDVLGHDSGEGDMTWADVFGKVESDAWTWEAAREEFLTHSPHVHAFVASEFVQGGAVTEGIESETGVVVERIADENGVSLGDMDALAAAVAYSLSHVGLTRDASGSFRAAYRPFGETATVERWASVRENATAALRRVSGDVLGVDFRRGDCRNDVLDADAERDAAPAGEGDDGHAPAPGRPDAAPSPAGSGSPSPSPDPAPAPFADGGSASGSAGNTGGYATDDGSDMWDATAGVSPSYLSDPGEAPDAATETCGGCLAPIWEAPEQLADDDWCAKIGPEAVADLREAIAEWRALGEPRPPPD